MVNASEGENFDNYSTSSYPVENFKYFKYINPVGHLEVLNINSCE